jgi:hypothetical protein
VLAFFPARALARIAAVKPDRAPRPRFRRLAASSTEEAMALADRSGIGRDDGAGERPAR